MAIQVTCPGCLKRFTVSDKFAGKTGPCPSCQKQIKIPDKSEEVVIHAPEEAGPKDSKGRAVLKPIRRKETTLKPPVVIGAGIGVLVVFFVALGLGLSGDQPATLLLALGSIILAFPLAFVGYWFLRDDELEGYSGKDLLMRCGLCSLGFAVTWAIYAFVPQYVSGYSNMGEMTGLDMVMFIPVMLIVGTLIALAALELELIPALMHYIFYFAVTFFLAWLAGAHLAQPLGGAAAESESPVNQTAPANPGAGEPTVPSTPESTGTPVPNLLQ